MWPQTARWQLRAPTSFKRLLRGTNLTRGLQSMVRKPEERARFDYSNRSEQEHRVAVDLPASSLPSTRTTEKFLSTAKWIACAVMLSSVASIALPIVHYYYAISSLPTPAQLSPPQPSLKADPKLSDPVPPRDAVSVGAPKSDPPPVIPRRKNTKDEADALLARIRFCKGWSKRFADLKAWLSKRKDVPKKIAWRPRVKKTQRPELSPKGGKVKEWRYPVESPAPKLAYDIEGSALGVRQQARISAQLRGPNVERLRCVEFTIPWRSLPPEWAAILTEKPTDIWEVRNLRDWGTGKDREILCPPLGSDDRKVLSKGDMPSSCRIARPEWCAS
ncbi:MAG: hypothetical protein ABL907_19485 [Hyphomicrobium sp.]